MKKIVWRHFHHTTLRFLIFLIVFLDEWDHFNHWKINSLEITTGLVTAYLYFYDLHNTDWQVRRTLSWVELFFMCAFDTKGQLLSQGSVCNTRSPEIFTPLVTLAVLDHFLSTSDQSINNRARGISRPELFSLIMLISSVLVSIFV